MLKTPQELDPATIWGVPNTGSIQLRPHGTAEAGSIYPACDGRRFLATVADGQAYFIQVEALPTERWKEGRLYKQSAFYFGADVGGFSGTSRILHVKLAATKSVLSDFIDIYLGCLAVAGGPTAMAITGMQLLVAGGKIKRNYSLYCDALQAFVGDNMELRRLMPTFHEQVYVGLFLGRIESDLTGKAKEMAAGAVPAPKAVKGLIGVFLGKVGEDALSALLKTIKELINEVLLKTIDHVLANKPALTEEQFRKLAVHHVVPMINKVSRVAMREDRAKEILREAARNAAAVKPRLQKIAAAIEAMG